MSGWFSDPESTRTVDLGSGVSFKVRFPLSRSDVARATAIEGLTDDAEIAAEIVSFIPEWTFPDHTGEARPVSPANFNALSLAGQTAVINGLAQAVRDSITVPNRSGAPSRDSSRRSASRSQSKHRTPTT